MLFFQLFFEIFFTFFTLLEGSNFPPTTRASFKKFSTNQSLQNNKMASSLTFSASVGQQQKVFSAKHASGSKKRVSVQTKAASFVRFCYVMFSLFLCLCNLSHFSDLFYFFFLSANLFNLSTRITTNRKKRAKRTDARHSQPRSPAKA